MAENNKAKSIADWFGGLSGNASKEIQDRKSKLDKEIDRQTNGDTESASGNGRPSQSKKWVE